MDRIVTLLDRIGALFGDYSGKLGFPTEINGCHLV
jgi:hypothetical protein